MKQRIENAIHEMAKVPSFRQPLLVFTTISIFYQLLYQSDLESFRTIANLNNRWANSRNGKARPEFQLNFGNSTNYPPSDHFLN